MFHSNTEQLIDYWRTRRIGLTAPARARIDPGEFAPILPQIFILGRRSFGDYAFRLNGGFVADLHGGDLRDRALVDLWEPEDRAPVKMALETVRRRIEPLVIDCDAWPEFGLPLRLEVMFAPLSGASGEIDRMIGLYQPMASPSVLMGRPVRALSIRTILAGAGASEAVTSLRLAAVNGRAVG